MATIVIRDLTESSELDRQAMQAIAGGSRLGGAGGLVRPAPRHTPLFSLRPRTIGMPLTR